jgi:pimeloyl-ACP methyl ester carboxylesterase
LHVNLRRGGLRGALPDVYQQGSQMSLSKTQDSVAPTDSGALTPLAAAAGLGLATAIFETYRRHSSERLNPPLGRFMEIDDVRLHYLDSGFDAHPEGGVEGGAVVLLHGNGVMIEDFVISGVLERVARRRRVVAFDRPGFGHSDKPRDRAWTAGAQADLVLKALRQLGIDRPVVVGHSWGTLVALAMAVDRPEAVGGLVLISGYYYPSLRADAAMFAPLAAPVVGDILWYTLAPTFGRIMKPSIVRKSFWPRPTPDRFETQFPFALALRPWQIRATAEDAASMAASAAELQERYSKLTIPVIILAGAEDAIVDVEGHAVRLHRDIAHSELRVKPEVGHMFHYAAPDWVADAVDNVATSESHAEARSLVYA